MRVIGYIRVSTEDQATEGVSLDAQRAKIRQYAELHGLDLAGIEEDGGISAKTLDRPGLGRALAMLAAGEAEGLVIVKLDRLSRSVADWAVLVDRYFGSSGGYHLASVGESIDTRSAAGRLVLNVLMSVAQWEREANSERTRAALDHKRSRGERVGQIPYGFRLAGDGVGLVEDPEDLAAIETIRGLRSSGHSLRKIAAVLDRAGVPTKRGGHWTHQSVAEILGRGGHREGANQGAGAEAGPVPAGR